MRIKYLFAFLLVVSAIFMSPVTLRAQVTTEETVKKNADNYFENGDYPAAMPLYSQLLSNHKDNPNYNYRYGVCVLFASSEKEKGLEFLEKASKSAGVDADVWFYLGKAYHLNYQFEQAITAYNKYKSLAGSKKAEKLQVDNQIAMCKTGRKLLKAITDITVLDRAELNEADFFRRYDLRGAGYSGQLLVKPDEFKTSLDKKKNEQSIIFLSGEKTELYFASYGEDESQGKDIYVVRKLPNGNWGKPQNVGYPINTEYDEDYPFLHPNGKVLYFSSKGHNSMGGYDIFRAELNEDVGTWQKPVNLDFAINSPDDDIMFISDLDEKTAWFASNRSSPEGKMTVYHVVIERKPVNMCLIAGTYEPTPGDPNRSAKITVKNAETNEPIGVYKSNEATGAYFMSLPNNGGKYTFTVDHSGIATQTENVFIPPQYSIKTVNQQIGYNEVSNESKLFILTNFDADTSMLDPSFLKDKAKLDINGDASTATEIVDLGHTPGTLPEAGSVDSSDGNDGGTEDSVDAGSEDPGNPPSKVRNDELLKSANEDAVATQQEATDLNTQKEKAWTNATEINTEAKAKTAEAKKAKEDADAMTEGPDKIAARDNAAKKQAEANALQSQAAAAISVAQGLDNDAKQKQIEADKTKQYATALDKAIKSNDPKALDAAVALGSELQAMSDTRSESGQTVSNLQSEADKKHKALDKAKEDAKDLQDEIAQNQQRIDQLNAEKAKEKDPELRNGMDAQIEGINEDIADDKSQLAAADKKAEMLQNQANDLDNQVKGANDAIAQSKNPGVTGSVISETDKKALQDDADSYQQSISETGTSRPFAAVSGTQTGGNEQSTTGSQTGTETSAAGTQTTGTQTSGSEQSTAGSQTGTETSATGTDPVVVTETTDPGIAFTESLQKTDTITDPVQREKAKAAVYSDWSASIDDQIRDKKQELAGTTDKKKKTEINADIKTLQDEKKQKDAEVKNSLAAADNEQKAQAANRPAVDETQFLTQLNTADTRGTTAEKENTKVDIYNAWADSLDAAAAVKEKGLPKIKDKKEQEQVKTEIAALRTEADTKRSLADDAHEKAMAAETSQPVAGSESSDVKYDDPAADAALNDQKKFADAAADNRDKKDSLTSLASSATGDAKNKLLTAATEQQRLAWENDSKASAKLGDANEAQFKKNDGALKGFDAAGITSSDPDVSVAGLLSGEARNLFEKAQQERDSANATSNNFIKTELLQQAEDNERKAIQKQQQSLALYSKSGIQPLAVGSEQSATGSQTGTETSTAGTQTTGTQTSGSEQSATGSQTGTETSAAGTQTPETDGSSVTSRLAPGEDLKLAPVTAVTTAPVITVNPALPEGLVYKVQIGAFRNPISAEIYKGISPVTAETTASGLTRYTAGFFTQFPNADAAKNEIRKLGYKDAFVVAFYNGKRVSIDEARRISGQPLAGTQTGTEPSTSGTQTTGTQTTGTEPAYSGTPNEVKATDVKELKGLFYTVQIGVYNSEVSKARLKNLPDIVSAHINGQIRYSSGKYCTTEQAIAAKNNAVVKGISDAFVTAYYNGARITLSEAATLIATGVSPCSDGTTPTTSTGDEPVSSGSQQPQSSGSEASSTGSQQPQSSGSEPSSTGSQQPQSSGSEPSSTGSQQPQSSGSESSSTDTQSGAQNPEPATTLSTKPPVPETGLVYSVQIGAFREEVPVEIANQFLQLASRGVKNYLDQSTGLTVYQFGVCMSKEEAEALRAEAVKVGITDAFIVAFKDGKKIPMEEAGQ